MHFARNLTVIKDNSKGCRITCGYATAFALATDRITSLMRNRLTTTPSERHKSSRQQKAEGLRYMHNS